MVAVEVVGADGHTPDAARAGAVSAYCHSQGVVTLTCGTYGNVLRFLPPLVISDALLTEAFEVVAAGFDATA
jgi:4-aminobutyrate aminotransferase/(S)-3-amino-2-methylpropionate transaminase